MRNNACKLRESFRLPGAPAKMRTTHGKHVPPDCGRGEFELTLPESLTARAEMTQ
jgi:hypothetical protein